MDCAQIRDSFVAGVQPSGEALRAHLNVCPHCRQLFEDDAALARSLAHEASVVSAFPQQLCARLESGLAHDSGPRAWLRSRPTRLRFQIAALSVLLAVLVGGMLHHRPDFGEYPSARLVLLLGGYFVVVLLAIRKDLTLSLRRDHLPLLAALAVPFLVALAPATEASRQAGPEGALGCFSYGALLTLPTAALLWAFDRNDRLSLRTVCTSAVALGLSANLVLELHCSSGNARHLLLGHASLGLAWLAAWWLTRQASRP